MAASSIQIGSSKQSKTQCAANKLHQIIKAANILQQLMINPEQDFEATCIGNVAYWNLDIGDIVYLAVLIW